MKAETGKIGIARLKGFDRLLGESKWDLVQLLAGLDTAICELEAEELGWADPLIDKFRTARSAIARLIALEGSFEKAAEEDSSSPPVLTEWEIVEDEFAYPRLEGLAFGHPRLTGFGRPIYTSLLLYIDTEQGYARTLSRFYQLGRKRGDRHSA